MGPYELTEWAGRLGLTDIWETILRRVGESGEKNTRDLPNRSSDL